MSHSSFPHAVSAWIADPSVATPAQGKIRKRPVHGVAKWLELRLARGLIQSKLVAEPPNRRDTPGIDQVLGRTEVRKQ